MSKNPLTCKECGGEASLTTEKGHFCQPCIDKALGTHGKLVKCTKTPWGGLREVGDDQ